MSRIQNLAQEIINGRRLNRNDNLSDFIETPLEEFSESAFEIQKHFCGNHIDLCTIINGKSGNCSEDCKYCAQSSKHKTQIDSHKFLPLNQIFKAARDNQIAGANRFSIVTSGRALSDKDLELAIESYKFMRKNLSIDLCASHGILNRDQLQKLFDAGVKSYHHNLETSRRFFPEICSTHTFDDRIATIKAAQSVGLDVCSGGIIGMGETWQDRIDLALELSELGIQSIPINILMPIRGTKLESQKILAPADVFRTIAIFRFINPTANIRLAAGRRVLPQNGLTAFKAGASASITGSMLTIGGTTIKGDIESLERMGFSNR